MASKLKEYGVEVNWENIGDPVQKGESIPGWMKKVLVGLLNENPTYAYSPTKGVVETREFLAARVNERGKVQITGGAQAPARGEKGPGPREDAPARAGDCGCGRGENEESVMTTETQAGANASGERQELVGKVTDRKSTRLNSSHQKISYA